MKTLNLFVFVLLVGSSWCGLIFNNFRDELHSKLYGPGHSQHVGSSQNSPIIKIKSQPTSSHHVPNGPRGDNGSLSHSHHVIESSIDSSHNMRGGGFRREAAGGISSHQMMKPESFKRRSDRKFGYHHDNNIFGNAQGITSSNDVPKYSSIINTSPSSSSLDVASSSVDSSNIRSISSVANISTPL